MSETQEITTNQENHKHKAKDIPIADIIEYTDKGLTDSEIARLTGCSRQNILRRRKQYSIQSLNNLRTHKDKVFEFIQGRLINSVTDDDIKKTPLGSRLLGLGLLQDKINVLRGQATDIYEIHSITATLQEATNRMRKAGLLRDDNDPIDVTNSLNEANIA
jgi:hypothetical protein